MAKKLGKQMSRTVCVANEVTVANQDEVYTGSIITERCENISVWVEAEGSTPHVRITRCINHNLSGEYPPKASEWAEGDLKGHEMIVAEDFTGKVLLAEGEQPPYAVYERFKLAGLADNGADTKITVIVVLGLREKPAGF